VPEPGSPQSLNRYSYTIGNPLKYTDPTGHKEDGECGLNGQDCIDVSGLWDPSWPQFVDDPEAAEQAFWLFITNPEYFIALYADTSAWTDSQEVASLEVFAEYSTLHTTAEALVLVGANPDIAAGLWGAHLQGGLDTEEGSNAFFAAAGFAFVPSPNGRKGGPEHQAATSEVIADIRTRGRTAKPEFRVDTPGGMKPYRFMDVAALDVEGNPVEFWQVGRVTLEGMPVARERYAIGDVLLNSECGPVEFTYVPYYTRYQR
jgi:hypothetical protein